MKTNPAGIELIKRFEGLRLQAYRCLAGVLTIGYGHTGDVEAHRVINEHQADAILSVDLDRFERGVTELTGGCGLNGNQFSALVSLAFNIGLEALKRSRLRRYTRDLAALSDLRVWGAVTGEQAARKRAASLERVASEFLIWSHVKGRRVDGLVKRREAERALFTTPVSLS
jgi:lysozyme